MTLKEAKKELLKYKDFYGGDLVEIDEIGKAESMEELEEIVNRHIRFLEDQLSDAINDIEQLKQKISL